MQKGECSTQKKEVPPFTVGSKELPLAEHSSIMEDSILVKTRRISRGDANMY